MPVTLSHVDKIRYYVLVRRKYSINDHNTFAIVVENVVEIIININWLS